MTSDAQKDLVFWMALAHLPEWRNIRMQELLVEITEKRRLSLAEFFEMDEADWQEGFSLSQEEVSALGAARTGLPEMTRLAGTLLKQGVDIITRSSDCYPPVMRGHAAAVFAPPVLYLKGNRRLLLESTLAVVSSRDVSEAGLDFAKTVGRKCALDRKVLVSGLVKGADTKALEALLMHRGRGLIVVPQGIMSYAAGTKKFQGLISDGDLAVVSPFHPRATTSVRLSMVRSACVYGLAEEVFVAELARRGSTWAGVVNGLKKGKRFYIRLPEAGEQNANQLLIAMGAPGVDSEGRVQWVKPPAVTAPMRQLYFGGKKDGFEIRIKRHLSSLGSPASAREIKEELNLDMESRRLSHVLQSMASIEATRNEKGTLLFALREEEDFDIF